MKASPLDMFVSLWNRDESFRREFHADPIAATESRGIHLSAHEWRAVAVLGKPAAKIDEHP